MNTNDAPTTESTHTSDREYHDAWHVLSTDPSCLFCGPHLSDKEAAELTARANVMQVGDLTIASVGADVDTSTVVLWMALPSGRTRRVVLTEKQSLRLVRQITQALEGWA